MKYILISSRLLLIILKMPLCLMHQSLGPSAGLSLRCLRALQSSHAFEDRLRHLTWLLLPGDQLQGLLLHLLLLHLLLHPPLLGVLLGLVSLADMLLDVSLIIIHILLPPCFGLKMTELWSFMTTHLNTNI